MRESLQFAARLRRSNDVSDAEKLEYVEKSLMFWTCVDMLMPLLED